MTALDPSTPLGRLEAGAAPGFDRDSAIRQVAGEPVVGLLVQRALVMEVLHPKVGAAVEAHSRFRRQPVRRLWTTLDAAIRLVWGTAEEARSAARQIYRFHDHVNGVLLDSGPAWHEGEPYTAHDARLLLWVWATLVDTAEVAYERWVRPLSRADRDAFYADMVAFARFFGIPAELIPVDRAAFAVYLDKMLDGDELQVTPTSETVVTDVLWFRHWIVPVTAVEPFRLLAVATLDTRPRERLGLALDAREQRRFERLDRALCKGYPKLPSARTQLPYLYLALRRRAGRWLPGQF